MGFRYGTAVQGGSANEVGMASAGLLGAFEKALRQLCFKAGRGSMKTLCSVVGRFSRLKRQGG